MTTPNAGTDPMSTLQNQWYNAVVSGMGLDPGRFQIAQPTIPLGDTSATLWAYFNNIPPRSLTSRFAASGGNRFYDDYAAVVSQLSSQGDGAFRQHLGDDYEAWLKYAKGLPQIPSAQDLPSVFRGWALVNAPDKAQQGATDLARALNDPIYRAQMAALDIKGVPTFSRTIEDLRSAIPQAASQTIGVDSARSSSNVTDTWAQSQTTALYGFFSGDIGRSSDQLSRKAAGSNVTVNATFDHALTFSADPGPWYVSAALAAAHSTRDNTLWRHGTPNWDSTFGSNGNMLRFAASIVVVDGITATIRSSASYEESEQQQIRASASTGIWPFFSFGGQSSHTAETRFASDGSMSVTMQNPQGNPVVLGVNVISVDHYLGGGGQSVNAAADVPE